MKKKARKLLKDREKKQNNLRYFSTVEVGETCRLDSCCREVRLGATPCYVGKELSGYNTLADRYEEWTVVQVCGTNHLRSLVKRKR